MNCRLEKQEMEGYERGTDVSETEACEHTEGRPPLASVPFTRMETMNTMNDQTLTTLTVCSCRDSQMAHVFRPVSVRFAFG